MTTPPHEAVVTVSVTTSSTATTVDGLLLYGVRRIRPGATALFRNDFEFWIAKHREHLVAALAFLEPSDDCLLHLVVWERQRKSSSSNNNNNNNEGKEDCGESCVLGFESEAFADVPEHDDGDNDGVFHAYGSGNLSVPLEKPVARSAVAKLHFHAALAGYMRKGPEMDTAEDALPMIGIFHRAIRPGARNALATSFQRVCDIWYDTVPGILAAMVVADEANSDYVHDVRIFANKASYDAHVDKSNPELTTAMDTWFSHYDTSIPHTGIMIAEDTSDPAMRTSSIKDRPVKVDFNMFHYGQDGCMGSCLDTDYFS